MASSKSVFTSFVSYYSPHILMANNRYMCICGKGSIDVDCGAFNDDLFVPSLSTNILSIYQITHGRVGKSVEFTPDYIIVWDSHRKDIVAIEDIDHQYRVYTFSQFSPCVPLIDVHTQTSSVNKFEEI